MDRIDAAMGLKGTVRYGIRVTGEGGDPFEEREILRDMDIRDVHRRVDDDVVTVRKVLVRRHDVDAARRRFRIVRVDDRPEEGPQQEEGRYQQKEEGHEPLRPLEGLRVDEVETGPDIRHRFREMTKLSEFQ